MAAPVRPVESAKHALDVRSVHPSVAAGRTIHSQGSSEPYSWAKGTVTRTPQPERVPNNIANSKQAVPSQNKLPVQPAQPAQPALCRVTSFYVGGNWPLDSSPKTAQHRVGQMYVEQLDPPTISQPNAIVLIHGDFHHGKVWGTKPDGNPGWASFFVDRGYQVFVVDLPPNGRSNFLNPKHFSINELRKISQSLSASFVERELTAQQAYRCHKRASKHKRWSGTGQRGDPTFASHCDTLSTLTIGKKERQRLAQDALSALLEKIKRKAVLIGEGAGGTMAWLAADVKPNLVAGVLSVEPVGPPFGKVKVDYSNGLAPTRTIVRDKSLRPYGITDIPLTFDPPVGEPDEPLGLGEDPLDVVESARIDNGATFYMQKGPQHGIGVRETPRQLINLKKMPHAIVTGEASVHMEYDWATTAFMRQAGLTVHWIQLEDHQILGNGHLMFLETNSNEIAELVDRWIQKFTNPLRSQALVIPRPESRLAGGPSAKPAQQRVSTPGLTASCQVTPDGTTVTFQTQPSSSVQGQLQSMTSNTMVRSREITATPQNMAAGYPVIYGGNANLKGSASTPLSANIQRTDFSVNGCPSTTKVGTNTLSAEYLNFNHNSHVSHL